MKLLVSGCIGWSFVYMLNNTFFILRRRFIEIYKQYVQDSRKERHKEYSEKNRGKKLRKIEERN